MGFKMLFLELFCIGAPGLELYLRGAVVLQFLYSYLTKMQRAATQECIRLETHFFMVVCFSLQESFVGVLVEHLGISAVLLIVNIPLIKSLRGSCYLDLRCCLYRKENILFQWNEKSNVQLSVAQMTKLTFWQNSDSEEKGTNFNLLVFVNTLCSKAEFSFWWLYSHSKGNNSAYLCAKKLWISSIFWRICIASFSHPD